MSRSKIISLRIDEDLLVEIDREVKRRFYMNRSLFIQLVLQNILENASKGSLNLLCSYPSFRKYGISILVDKVETKKEYVQHFDPSVGCILKNIPRMSR